MRRARRQLAAERGAASGWVGFFSFGFARTVLNPLFAPFCVSRGRGGGGGSGSGPSPVLMRALVAAGSATSGVGAGGGAPCALQLVIPPGAPRGSQNKENLDFGGPRRAGNRWDSGALGCGDALPKCLVSSVCEAAAIRRDSTFTMIHNHIIIPPIPISKYYYYNLNINICGVCVCLGAYPASSSAPMRRCSSAVPSTRSPPALPMRIAPGHPASRTPTPTAVTV